MHNFGMANTYDRWIHPGEPLHAEPDAEAHHVDGDKVSKSSAAVAAHVIDLEERLDREMQQTEAMREELAAIKKKSEEAEAARNKEHQLLLKKSEENEARYAHLMETLGKISGK